MLRRDRTRHWEEKPIPASFVTVRDLVFDYGAARAIDGVSFELAPGTVTALVGPNGAGKTTLLRCLAGLEQWVSGEIAIDGIDVEADPRLAHRRLGFLQDFFGLYESLSVARNLLHAGAAQGLGGAALDAAVVRAAGSVGLSDRMGQPAGELSRGLRQRLAIARAIVHEPSLLLLDEPAAGLDPEARGELSGLVRQLGAAGMTIVVSSHILAELEEYSTHMLAMRGGKLSELRAVGTVAGAARRLRVGILGDPAAAAAFLSARAEVSGLRPDGSGFVFDLAGDEVVQAALLRAMVDSGIAVASLAEAAIDLQAIYLAEAQP